MASRLWQLCIPIVALVLTSACIQVEGGDGTTTIGVGSEGPIDSGVDTFDSGQEGFEDGGLLGECGQYLSACEQDPYCVCYLQCAVEYETTVGCLERCQLATTPYWAEQFIACFASDIGEIPGQDSGDGGGTGG